MIIYFLNNVLGLFPSFCFQAKTKPPIITRSDKEASAAVPRVWWIADYSHYLQTTTIVKLLFFYYLLVDFENYSFFALGFDIIALICLLRSLKSCMRCTYLYMTKWSWCLNERRGAKEVNKLFISITQPWQQDLTFQMFILFALWTQRVFISDRWVYIRV